ncbi:MAG: transglutaminase domain-containing protein [Candidatus Krumholzibacteriota bacterium]
MKKWGWTAICGAAFFGIILGMVRPADAGEKQSGSFWYAVDNINEVAEDARILVWVTLPPAWPGQEVEVTDISPAPAAILEDPVSGNRIIEWLAEPAPRFNDQESPPAHQFFHFDLEVEEKPVRFDIDPSRLETYDKSSELYRRYTAPETWIQTGGKVLDQAREIVGQEKNAWVRSGLIYDWLIHNMAFIPGGRENRDAISTLEAGTGDCGQFSVLFTALCRSIGIPARTVTYAWLDGGQHVFAEAFMPGYGWMPVDVSLGQMLLPGGGGMSPEEVAAFMKIRGVPLGDPRWFFGNLPDGRLITGLGNNIHFESPTLGRKMTFQRMQPGGNEATPAALVAEGLNASIISGGFFVFGREVADDQAAHTLVHQNLASSFFKVGLYDVVEDGCRQALVQSGDGIQVWINIGKVHMHKGEYYKAEAAFKRALSGVAVKRNEKMDALIWTHNYLGNCYDLLGHRDMALEEYQIVVDLGNNYRGALDYARKYQKRPFKHHAEDQ